MFYSKWIINEFDDVSISTRLLAVPFTTGSLFCLPEIISPPGESALAESDK